MVSTTAELLREAFDAEMTAQDRVDLGLHAQDCPICGAVHFQVLLDGVGSIAFGSLLHSAVASHQDAPTRLRDLARDTGTIADAVIACSRTLKAINTPGVD